jgi:5'-3' exoribonuclease 2
VRFGEEGWKPRYYSSKIHIDRDRKEDGVIFHKLFKSYAEGLAWVMKYYYEGCASWSWYYPFHYAPMASDLTNLDRYKIEWR